MIQTTSPLCSLNSVHQPFSSLPLFRRLNWTLRSSLIPSETPSSSAVRLPLRKPHNLPLALTSSSRVATHEIIETTEIQSGFVEVGFISGAHGIQGEVRVKPTTGFPELRLSEPGKRWLKQEILGKERIQEVELVEGRGHPGQKSWILKLEGIDTAEEAKLLSGSTLLVREEDRPELEEGDFYTRDLLGMRVILKETGEFLGTVVNVYNSGGNDLLKVMVHRSPEITGSTGDQSSNDVGVSGHTVWIPFVEVIVPNVDLIRREMHITPPKGLLELNLRTDERSKKERRQLEWKERRKFQKRLIAAKKKLCEMEQQHVFHGFGFGEKSQVKLLSEEIMSVNSKLLRQALQDIEIPSKRWTMTDLSNAIERETLKNSLKISEEGFISNAKQKEIVSFEGKTAIVLVVNDEGWGDDFDTTNCGSTKNPHSLLQTLLHDTRRFAEIEDRPLVPLILVSPANRIPSIEKLFLDNEYFAFDSSKVWFLEEEKLPVVSHLVEDQKWRKILMKSPWEILQSPIGSGGVINSLLSHNLIDRITEIGVDYIEICSNTHKYAGMNLRLLEFLGSNKADIGVQLFQNTNNDESFDIIFSIDFLKKLAKQTNKLQFYAVPKANSHIEMVDKEWIDAVPSTTNSNELRCSILGSLNVCSLDKVCAIQIGE